MRHADYCERAWTRVLEAAEAVARENPSGRLEPNDLDRLTFTTPYANVSSLHRILWGLREGALGEEIAIRARRIATGKTGRRAVNKPVIARLMALGWASSEAIHQEVNAERRRLGMNPAPISSIRVTIAHLKKAQQADDRQGRVRHLEVAPDHPVGA